RQLVLVDKFTVEDATRAITEFAPSSLALTPAMIQMLATAPGHLELTSVRSVTSGSAPLAPEVKELFTRRFGVPILQSYGMTELGNVAKERLADVEAGRQPPGAVGRISPGREVKVVDDDGTVLAAGAEGNLLVRAVGGAPPSSTAPLDAD